MEQYEIYPVFGSLSNNVILYLLIAGWISLSITHFQGDYVVNDGILNESLYRTILVMITDYISLTHFFPLIYTIFHFILFTNFIGMVPYTSCSSVKIIITLTIAFTLLAAVISKGALW